MDTCKQRIHSFRNLLPFLVGECFQQWTTICAVSWDDIEGLCHFYFAWRMADWVWDSPNRFPVSSPQGSAPSPVCCVAGRCWCLSAYRDEDSVEDNLSPPCPLATHSVVDMACKVMLWWITDFCQSQQPAKSQCDSNPYAPGALLLPSDLHGGFATGETSTPSPGIGRGGAAPMNETRNCQAAKLKIGWISMKSVMLTSKEAICRRTPESTKRSASLVVVA